MSFVLDFLYLLRGLDRDFIGNAGPVSLIRFQELSDSVLIVIWTWTLKGVPPFGQKLTLNLVLDPLDFTFDLLFFAFKLLE